MNFMANVVLFPCCCLPFLLTSNTVFQIRLLISSLWQFLILLLSHENKKTRKVPSRECDIIISYLFVQYCTNTSGFHQTKTSTLTYYNLCHANYKILNRLIQLISRIVHKLAALCKVVKYLHCLLHKHAIDETDAAIRQFLFPVLHNRPFVKSSDLLQFRSVTRNDQLADARPEASGRSGAYFRTILYQIVAPKHMEHGRQLTTNWYCFELAPTNKYARQKTESTNQINCH